MGVRKSSPIGYSVKEETRMFQGWGKILNI